MSGSSTLPLGDSEIIDDLSDLSGWVPVVSGLAQLTISPDQGLHGNAMRLDFDFKGGGGFVVARKPLTLTLPETYVLAFNIRGSAPPNKFEIKLADPSGQNVWWFHRDAFDFPAQWQAFRIRSSEIEFAWGPAGGGMISQVAAVEIVIAAGPGGKGSVWIDTLCVEDHSFRGIPLVRAASSLPGHEPEKALGTPNGAGWRSAQSAEPQWLLVDFQREREYGGLLVHWQHERGARHFDVETSNDQVAWKTVYSARNAAGERSYIYLPGASSRYLRLNLIESTGPNGFGIAGIEVKPFDFSRSLHAFFHNVAKDERRGSYPKYTYREQTYWSPVGVSDGNTCALLNEEGMVEVDKGSFSIEPFLFVDGRLVTWADVTPVQQLEDGYLPIPSSLWQLDGLSLRTTAFAIRHAGKPILYVRYRIECTTTRSRRVRLFAALRPFQVTPPWQAFGALGGGSPINELELVSSSVRVNGSREVFSLTPPQQFGAAPFAQGAITQLLRTGELSSQSKVTDDFGYASGALRYDLDLTPGTPCDVYLAIPFGTDGGAADLTAAALPDISGAPAFERAVEAWKAKLGRFGIALPGHARAYVDTLKTAAAHILVNRDGPALQPGPRRYTRSWVRDGAIMAAALLRLGCNEESEEFIRWYVTFQAADGNVPCCVDRSGADWLVEHDSHGQLIFAIMECFRFSGNREFLSELWPAARRAVDHIEALRKTRLTAEYETAEKRARYGLLPESASHEGYLAHPVHAYWDDFWALRGLRDAVAIAETLGDGTQARRIAALRDAFRTTLYASIDVTLAERKIDYVPGSVEWADFDPTATSNAVSLLDELRNLPRAALDRTFDTYLAGFRRRCRGEIEWANYTAYEIRIFGALVHLGRRDDANELAEFFLSDRRPLAWNQWPEISWRDSTSPGHIGDVPHSWISAEYILAFRSMLAFEREADRTLVIAAGVPAQWLDGGSEVVVTDLPTYYGKLSYRLSREGTSGVRLSLSGVSAHLLVKAPLARPIARVEINGRNVDTFDADSVSTDACPATILISS